MARQKRSNGETEQQQAAIRAAPARATTQPRGLMSALLDRFAFANRSGLSFETGATTTAGFRRDMTVAAGYKRTLRPEDYRSRYERGGIAERIVEAYPLATWSAGASIQEDPDPEVSTRFEQEVADLFDRLDAWERLKRADILSGLGRFGVLIIGAEGSLDSELPRLTADGIVGLWALGEDRVTIQKYDEDTGSERFGLPLVYSCTLAVGKTERVHYTRVLHVAEGRLDDDVFGKPRLRAVWNRLDDLDKVIGGGAEAAWRRADPGVHLDIDPMMEYTSEEEAELADQVDEYANNLRRVLRTRGVKLDMLSAGVAGFGPNADAIRQDISATTGIPHRILTGSERGELASTQDRNNWNERVAERRSLFAEPLVRDLVDRLIEHGALVEPESYELVWPEADELDEGEKADLVARIATANKAQHEAEGTVIVTADELRDSVLGLAPLADVMPVDEPVDFEEDEAILAAAARFADHESPEPEWRSIHRVADDNVDRVARVVSGLFSDVGNRIDGAAVERALAVNNRTGAEQRVMDAVQDALDDGGQHERLRLAIKSVFDAGAEAAIRSARARGSWYAVGPRVRAAQLEAELRFDAVNPRAVAWAERRAAELVRDNVTDATRLWIRSLIIEAFERGIPPRVAARQIRAQVGLLSRHSRAVERLAEQMRSARPGSLITRFPPRPGIRQNPGFRVRIPPSGASEPLIARSTARYRDMLRNLRARTIARSETLRAANAGQRELWQQGVDAGQLPVTVQREWIATLDSRVREEHAGLHGERVGLNEPFPGGIEPGEEPNCRCAQGLVDPDESRSPSVFIPPSAIQAVIEDADAET